MAKAKTTGNEQVVEEKLRNLYELQKVYSTIDKIRIVRGELPLEVTDLEDEVIDTPDKGVPSALLTTFPETIFC